MQHFQHTKFCEHRWPTERALRKYGGWSVGAQVRGPSHMHPLVAHIHAPHTHTLAGSATLQSRAPGGAPRPPWRPRFLFAGVSGRCASAPAKTRGVGCRDEGGRRVRTECTSVLAKKWGVEWEGCK
eukprot:366159-Chlamydomonas_euryale.AAC.1